MNPDSTDEAELRLAYYKKGEFVNRPLTVAPTTDIAEQVPEVVPTMASLARTFTPDEIAALVEDLGEDKVLELSVVIEELGKNRLTEILNEATE
jgi:dihydroxyacetone kinase